MNQAKEKAVRESVRNALLKLADGNTHTRMDLFGAGTPADVKRSYRILEILRERGLIHSALLETTGPALHEAKKASELRAIAENDTELTRLIWPSKAPGQTSPELMNALNSLMSIEPEAPIAASAHTHEASAEPSLQEQIGAILRLVAALAENVIYVRGKIDELNSVACSHCAEPEKHQ